MEDGTGITSDNREDLIAKALNQLTPQERNRIIEQVHGVDEVVEETPKFVRACLEDMELELESIEQKAAYEQAFRTNENYVTNPEFRIMFLRAVSFSARAAALRMVRFLETKLHMFGPETLTRPLRLSDLDRDTMEMLKSGFHQMLPRRTRSGKAIILSTPPLYMKPHHTPESSFKLYFYVMSTHAETDAESQKRGSVAVVYFPGTEMGQQILEVHKAMGGITDVLPMRQTVYHFCSEVGFYRSVNHIVMAGMAMSMRVRARFHHGTVTEWKYSLLTFGVPAQHLPVLGGNGMRNSPHSKWIAKQKVRDRMLKSNGHFLGIDVPGPYDILLGRGRVFQDHSGNVRMREIVGSYLDEYANAYTSKEGIARQALEDIRMLEGKFLERDENGWFQEVSENAALEKIGASFRTMVSSANKVQQQQQQHHTPAMVGTTHEGRHSVLEARNPSCFMGCFNVPSNHEG